MNINVKHGFAKTRHGDITPRVLCSVDSGSLTFRRSKLRKAKGFDPFGPITFQILGLDTRSN